MNKLGNSYFTPNCVLGITSGANENSSLFVQLILEKEIQKADIGNGLPVNLQAFEEIKKFSVNKYKLDMDIQWEEMVGKLKPATVDDFLTKKAKEHGLLYLQGDCTIQEAITNVKKDVDMWLKEQS